MTRDRASPIKVVALTFIRRFDNVILSGDVVLSLSDNYIVDFMRREFCVDG